MGDVHSSTLIGLEIVRVLRRERLSTERAGEALDRGALVSIDDALLRAAAAIEPRVRSLDAIHLATCALSGSEAELTKPDAAMRAAASELDRRVMDPLDDRAEPRG